MPLFSFLRSIALGLLLGLAPLGMIQANTALPDIGIAAASSLTTDQEIRIGGALMLLFRQQQQVMDDPVLEQYLDDLGSQLINHAENVAFPFHFFLVNDPTINAAATFGGYIRVNTGLFLYAQNESQLASVLAHEISHVTQRHLARQLEQNDHNKIATLAGLVGSLALGIINPNAGMAALTTTLGLNAQSHINFTRSDESEADSIGIKLLSRSGFDPEGMMQFFEILKQQNRYSATPLPFLLDHPLTNDRIAQARNRAANFPAHAVKPKLSFLLAKARITARNNPSNMETLLEQFARQAKSKKAARIDAANYGTALILMRQEKNKQALTILEQLLKKAPNNQFYLDAITDTDIALNQAKRAIARLKPIQAQSPDNVTLVINLANAYISNHQPQQAVDLLTLYLRKHSQNSLAWQLMTQAANQTGNQYQLYMSQAEFLALNGQFDQAIDNLLQARKKSKRKLDTVRIDARIQQLKQQKIRWQAILDGS